MDEKPVAKFEFVIVKQFLMNSLVELALKLASSSRRCRLGRMHLFQNQCCDVHHSLLGEHIHLIKTCSYFTRVSCGCTISVRSVAQTWSLQRGRRVTAPGREEGKRNHAEAEIRDDV